MFKYHERSDSVSSRHNIKWKEIKPESYEVQVDSFESALEWLKEEEWWVHDCDGGNDFTYHIGLTDGSKTRYYEVNHDFWAEYGEHFTVHNSFTVKESTKEQNNIPDDRDWLNISEYNYKLAKKWPPDDLG